MTNENRVRRMLALFHPITQFTTWPHRKLRDELKSRRSGYSIIDVDNYGGDYDTELLIETGFKTETEAEARRAWLVENLMVASHFRKYGDGSTRYLVVRPAWKKLAVFEGY